MPAPGTTAWALWYQKQTPDIQNAVMYSFSNALPSSQTAGGMAPQIDPNSYALSQQTAAPVDLNAKGNIVPFDLTTAGATTNVIQDRNSLMPDQTLAMLSGTGAYGPDAFSPTFEPVGTPVQQNGQTLMTGYSGAGGYQGFLAQHMLKGMSPSAAMGELIKTIVAPDAASLPPEAQQARDELINSLPPRTAQPDPITGVVAPVDLTSQQGVANSFDLKTAGDWATKMYEQVLTDPSIGYTDPTTGQNYASAKEVKTPAMEFYDKAGLPYPTAKYDDPSSISAYQDSIAPLGANTVSNWQSAQANTATGVDRAKTAADDRGTDLQKLVEAYKATQYGTWSAPGMSSANQHPALHGGQGGFSMGPNGQIYPTGPLSPMPSGAATQSGTDPQQVDAQLHTLASSYTAPLSPWVTTTPGSAGTTKLASGPNPTPQNVQGMAPAAVNKMASANPGGQLSMTRRAGPGDVDKASQQQALAQQALQQAIVDRHNAQAMPEELSKRLLAMATMQRLAMNGRTPTQDALAQRMLTARAQGAYGY